ncbi:MAG: hypothetical protein Q7S82_02440 [bacterium]|nr:hypothetical protein [bacterium]
MQSKNKNFLIIGFSAGFSLLILYFLILSLANSFSHAISQFSQLWYWILVLAAGFGTQVGLYCFTRALAKGEDEAIASSTRPKQIANSATVVAVSGSISSGSMIVCCLHHLADVLPFIGLAGATLFLIQYQTFFLFLGVLSNIVGVTIMLEIIQKHQFTSPVKRDEFKKRTQFSSLFEKISVYDLGRVKKFVIVFSLILLPVVFFIINNQTGQTISPQPKSGEILTEKINLPSKINSQGGITFEVQPLDFSFEKSIQFEITIDTHSGSLDFDPAKISVLEDGNGNRYPALEWQGSPAGGHHISGILIFPKLNGPATKLKLTIQDNFLRIFEWEL